MVQSECKEKSNRRNCDIKHENNPSWNNPDMIQWSKELHCDRLECKLTIILTSELPIF